MTRAGQDFFPFLATKKTKKMFTQNTLAEMSNDILNEYKRIFTDELNLSLFAYSDICPCCGNGSIEQKKIFSQKLHLENEWLDFFFKYPNYIPKKFITNPSPHLRNKYSITLMFPAKYYAGTEIFYYYPSLFISSNEKGEILKIEKIVCQTGFDWSGYFPCIDKQCL